MKILKFLPVAAALMIISCSNAQGNDAASQGAATETAAATTDMQGSTSSASTADNSKGQPAVTVITDDRLPEVSGKLVVIDFNATWCGPCRKFAPNFDRVAEKYKNKAMFYSVDVDKNPRLATRFGIRSIPTVVYIQPNGNLSASMGYLELDEFNAEVESRL